MPAPVSPDPSDSSPAHRYTAELANQIEVTWQHAWESAGVYRAPNPGEPGFDPSKPKFYCLDMFPYPSGAGLHVGHPEGYTATDILCRYKRARGFNVLHPMGYDAFGLPAEQYAIQTGVHPAVTTKQSIENFRRQLKRFGFSYDWSREFATIDPGYYKWTQWIFLKLYHAWVDPRTGKARPIGELERELDAGTAPDGITEGQVWSSLSVADRRAVIDNHRLAYLAEATVNWCPRLGTVLANDEVIDGKSERGGHPVVRKPLKQWMFRITAMAQRLLDDLDRIDWPVSTKTMQSEWIGRSEGAEIEFEVGRLSEPTPRCNSTNAALTEQHPADDERRFRVRCDTFVPRDPYPPGEASPRDLIGHVRHLPHVRLNGATYFVTWSVKHAESIPESARPEILQSLRHFDGDRAEVYAAGVMPDHVHWLVRPFPGVDLDELVASVKRYSAARVNKLLGRTGQLWQEDTFDHIVRDSSWFGEFVRYIARNPVEAGICARVRDSRFTYIASSLSTEDGRALGVGFESAVQDGVGSEGRPTSELKHQACLGNRATAESLRVFTTRPDTIFGATYMVVAPEHPLVRSAIERPAPRTESSRLREYVEATRRKSDVDRQADTKTKTGVDTGYDAVNPATGRAIPIWTADYVLMGYGTGAIMAVPGQDQRDWDFAKAFGLPIVRTVMPTEGFDGEAYTGDGPAINSGFLDGLSIADAKARIIAWLEDRGIGRRRVNYRLRDWAFSRQRYWGEPFPIVYDREGNHYPVSDAALPVVLPELADYSPVESDEPMPLLAKASSWVNTTAGRAGVDPALLPPETPVRRETNTMPGSAGSSWYFLRYCDARNPDRFVGREAERYWMVSPKTSKLQDPKAMGAGWDEAGHHFGGVDFYLGGSEHAVGHLLYARFWHKVLYDLGEVSTPEPFGRLFHQGLITSFAFQRADKTLCPNDQVEEVSEGKYVERATGAPVTPIVAKMSKSLKNVVNPDDVIAQYGADTFRLYEMYMGPLEASKPWNPRDIVGMFRFLQKLWRVAVDEESGAPRFALAPDDRLERRLHRVIAKAGSDIESLAFNTAISAFIELVNEAGPGGLTRDQLRRLIVAVSPFTPHIAEELWSRLGLDREAGGFACAQPWPAVDPAMLVDDEVEVPVQVNGKLRGRVRVPTGADAKAVEAIALGDAKVTAALEGKPVKRVIVVPGRMVNVIV